MERYVCEREGDKTSGIGVNGLNDNIGAYISPSFTLPIPLTYTDTQFYFLKKSECGMQRGV